MGIGPGAQALAVIALAGLVSAQSHTALHAEDVRDNACRRPFSGSAVPEPEDLRSRNGELTVDLSIHNYIEAAGAIRYCYTTADGKASPNLQLNPGDLLVLNLKNNLKNLGNGASKPEHHHEPADTTEKTDPCISGFMAATSTNLHFHG